MAPSDGIHHGVVKDSSKLGFEFSSLRRAFHVILTLPRLKSLLVHMLDLVSQHASLQAI
jgi:hypothetical protein